MSRCTIIEALVVALALSLLTADDVSSQLPARTAEMRSAERRVVRLNVGLANLGDKHLGADVDLGLTRSTSVVWSVRGWRFESYGCVRPGPVPDEFGYVPPSDHPPCVPDGWSASGGLRGRLWILFGEVDLGLYRYDHDQMFVAPYAGIRAGLAPSLWPGAELQIAKHLITISSYSRHRFDFGSWTLGSWDIGLGIQLELAGGVA